jgi:hypothetical protein
MHAELKSNEFDSTQDMSSASEEASGATFPSAHSLLSVLLPANPPPVPLNARIIRLFDIEAAKYDPRPGEPAPAKPAPKDNSRAAAREERSKSLFAAARYF